MYSRRFDWGAEPHPLSQAMGERMAQGETILNLVDANPTRCGFTYPEAAILSAIARPDVMIYNPVPKGLLAAREAISAYYREQGADVPAERILLTAGTSEAYGLLFKLLADPGDEILIPRPGYPLLSHLAGFEGLICHSYPLRYTEASGWTVDLDVLSALVTTRTRAVVVVSPNNPTGNYIKSDELAAMDALCCQHGLALIVDEVFADFPRSSHPAVKTVVNRTSALTFVLNGVSKVLGLPQLKLGWIVAGGDSCEAITALDRLELLMDFYLTVGTPVQTGTAQLLAGRRDIQHQINTRLADNEAWLDAQLAGTANICRLSREGGWYAVLSIDDAVDDDARALTLIEKARTLIHPGLFYDFHREGFVVLSLLLPPDRFSRGVLCLIRRFGRPAA